MRSSMEGLARPVRTVAKLRFVLSMLFSMRDIWRAARLSGEGRDQAVRRQTLTVVPQERTASSSMSTSTSTSFAAACSRNLQVLQRALRRPVSLLSVRSHK